MLWAVSCCNVRTIPASLVPDMMGYLRGATDCNWDPRGERYRAARAPQDSAHVSHLVTAEV